MSRIAAKRAQQALFEATASMNRAAGSGGGSGLQAMVLVGSGSNYDGSYNTTSTSDVVITGVTTTFTVARTGSFWIVATVTGKVSGGAGTYGYGTTYVDSVAQTHTIGRLVALWDKNNAGFTSHTGTQLTQFAPGSHTVDLRLHVDNAALTYNHYEALLEVFQLSA